MPGQAPGEADGSGHRGDGGEAETIQRELDLHRQPMLVEAWIASRMAMLEQIRTSAEVEEKPRRLHATETIGTTGTAGIAPAPGTSISTCSGGGIRNTDGRREAAAPLRQTAKTGRVSDRIPFDHGRPIPAMR